MIKVTHTRNKLGLEDILVGTGTQQQVRGAVGSPPVDITEINGSNFPYDDTFSMADKIDNLQGQMDTLPEVVDQNGNLLTGLINTSATNLNLVDRLWRKTIDAETAELYYYNELLFQYNPTSGNIYIPGGADYISADVVVTNAYLAADAIIQALLDGLTLDTLAVHGLDVGTDPNNLVQLDGTGKLPAVDGSQLTNVSDGNPVGTILTVPYSTPDINYMECNGIAIDRVIHSILFSKIGTTYGAGDGSVTFNIPDYRGEFLRGWDNGKGIDVGRALASFQLDEFKSHTHEGTKRLLVNNDTPQQNQWLSDGSAETGATGGAETRPRNYSVMYQIKVL